MENGLRTKSGKMSNTCKKCGGCTKCMTCTCTAPYTKSFCSNCHQDMVISKSGKDVVFICVACGRKTVLIEKTKKFRIESEGDTNKHHDPIEHISEVNINKVIE